MNRTERNSSTAITDEIKCTQHDRRRNDFCSWNWFTVQRNQQPLYTLLFCFSSSWTSKYPEFCTRWHFKHQCVSVDWHFNRYTHCQRGREKHETTNADDVCIDCVISIFFSVTRFLEFVLFPLFAYLFKCASHFWRYFNHKKRKMYIYVILLFFYCFSFTFNSSIPN